MSFNLEHANLKIFRDIALKLGGKIIGVDRFLLEDAKGNSPMGEFARDRVANLLPGSRENWVEIGSYYEDLTHFSEEENKWEYDTQDDILFVKKEDLEEARREWERENSRPLRHNPFGNLLR